MCEAVWGEYQHQTWPSDIIFTPQVNLNFQIWGQLGRWTNIRVHTCGLETAYQWLKPLCIYLMWIWEVVWGGYQPQPWCYGIIFTAQVNLNSQIQISGQLGWCNGIQVYPYGLQTACQWLRHFSLFICLIRIWEAVWGGYHPRQSWPHDLIFTPQATLNFQIWGQLRWCNGIKKPLYALETA